MPPKLGIVAGGGKLPGLLARCALDQGREVFVLALERQADPSVVTPFDHAWVRLGAAGTALDRLRREKVEEIVLAGPVRRPSMIELLPDRRSARILATGILDRGDDGLLTAIIRILEQEEGYRVIGIQDILGGILAPDGVLTAREPDSREETDIARGIAVLEGLETSDVGQAVSVQQGLVLAVEAAEGTDALIERSGSLRRPGPGPVLVKFSKSGQDLRADQPTIGPRTAAACIEAGFSGVAVEAGKSLIVDRDEVVEMADRHGMFLKGLSR